jgi:hypothetical protein
MSHFKEHSKRLGYVPTIISLAHDSRSNVALVHLVTRLTLRCRASATKAGVPRFTAEHKWMPRLVFWSHLGAIKPGETPNNSKVYGG